MVEVRVEALCGRLLDFVIRYGQGGQLGVELLHALLVGAGVELHLADLHVRHGAREHVGAVQPHEERRCPVRQHLLRHLGVLVVLGESGLPRLLHREGVLAHQSGGLLDGPAAAGKVWPFASPLEAQHALEDPARVGFRDHGNSGHADLSVHHVARAQVVEHIPATRQSVHDEQQRLGRAPAQVLGHEIGLAQRRGKVEGLLDVPGLHVRRRRRK